MDISWAYEQQNDRSINHRLHTLNFKYYYLKIYI